MNRVARIIAGALLWAAGAPHVLAECWVLVPQTGKIVFTGTQAGAPVHGTFSEYAGRVCIHAGDPAASRIRVSVRTASVDTQLPELDKALRGPDFFNSARWPQAVFDSESVKPLGPGRYQVTGKLTLRDVTREISVPIRLTPAGGGDARLSGQWSLQRLDYHIGLGQWADTEWVGNRVEILFSVALKPVAGK